MYFLPSSVTHQNAMQVRQDGLKALKDQSSENCQVNAALLEHFDSTLLSVLLTFAREHAFLKIINTPEKLIRLSKVYGLDELMALQET